MSDSVKAGPDAYGQLKTRLDAKRLKRNEPLAQYTTFRIGGPADLFYDATSTDDLAGAVTAARDLGIEYFVLGLGANVPIACTNGSESLMALVKGEFVEFDVAAFAGERVGV